MPNVKISELSDASTLTGAELVELVQSGGNVKAAVSAIAALAGGGDFAVTANVYTAVGGATYTKPAGLAAALVLVVGGGGSGGVAPSGGDYMASGGAAGGVAVSLIAAASIGGTETVTVGGGGSARSSASAGNGNAGSASSFGAHLSATGGGAGRYNAGSDSIWPSPGAGSGGNLLNLTGMPCRTRNSQGIPSGGGDTPLGLGSGGQDSDLYGDAPGANNRVPPYGYGSGGTIGYVGDWNSQAGLGGLVIAINLIVN